MPSMLDLLSDGLSARDALMALLAVGGPLLIAFLLRRPVTPRLCWLGAWLFVTLLGWMTTGNIANDAYQRGQISLFACIVIVGGLFAVLAASNVLLERWSRPNKTEG